MNQPPNNPTPARNVKPDRPRVVSSQGSVPVLEEKLLLLRAGGGDSLVRSRWMSEDLGEMLAEPGSPETRR